MMLDRMEWHGKSTFGGDAPGPTGGGNRKKFSYVPPEEFETWLRTSGPVDTAVYHIGNLVRASESHPHVGDLRARIWVLSDLGFLFLTQRRVGYDQFEYLATRSSRSGPFPKRERRRELAH